MNYNDEFVLLPDQMFDKMAKEYERKLLEKNNNISIQHEINNLYHKINLCNIYLQAININEFSHEVVAAINNLKTIQKTCLDNIQICYGIKHENETTNSQNLFNCNIFKIIGEIVLTIKTFNLVSDLEKNNYNKNIIKNNQHNYIDGCFVLLDNLSKNGCRFFKHF